MKKLIALLLALVMVLGMVACGGSKAADSEGIPAAVTLRETKALKGKTLATAESCTGGLVAERVTNVPGSSEVYKGGVISYTDEIKREVLCVPPEWLEKYGAVSAPVAGAMASGVRNLLQTDVAVSVTGLAGPGGDEYGNPVDISGQSSFELTIEPGKIHYLNIHKVSNVWMQVNNPDIFVDKMSKFLLNYNAAKANIYQ